MEIDELLILAQSPIRYLNREVNSFRKDPARAELKAALCFPDIYEIGISHLGHRLLYHILNRREQFFCDRVYAPWVDFGELLKKKHLELFGLESKLPLKQFDLLGFTLPNELCYSNVLYMLGLAGIPLHAEDRNQGNWPLVIGGGPCASNPEPVAAFFDAFFFGEADEAIMEIADAVLAWKKQGDGKKKSLFTELCKIQGVYIPSLYQHTYHGQNLTAIKPVPPAPPKVLRRIVPDLDQTFFPVCELVPFAEAVHDRYVIEIARGCTRGCRFCHAGIIYRPYRERTPEKVLELAREGLKATGYEELSLLSLSAGDYSSIDELIVRLIVEHYPKRVAVSLPSLRAVSLGQALLQAIKRVRKTGFTIAPEAGTERLRRVLNKDITDQEIQDSCEKALQAGWRSLKFYFMVGLPTETEEDIAGIVNLARNLCRIAKRIQPSAQLNLSVSGFVPKPHTPFQWEKQLGMDELAELQSRLKKDLARERVKLKMEDPRNSLLEGVFSRAGREMAVAIETAHQKGARFDGWTEQFKFSAWLEAFAENNISPDDYLKERPENFLFPCAALDPGVSSEFLIMERERARRTEISEDCREAGCIQNCGVCDQKTIKPRVSPARSPKSAEELLQNLDRLPIQPDLYFRYLVRYSRIGDLRFIGLLENNRLFLRAVRRADLPMRYSQGYHPLPKISFSPAPPVGVETKAEFIELELLKHLSAEDLKKSLAKALPPGIEILETREISLKTPSIAQMITSMEYEVTAPEDMKTIFAPEKIDRFNRCQSFVIEQKREKGNRSLDLKQKIKFLELLSDNKVKFGLSITDGPSAKPHEVIASIFGLGEEELARMRICRTGVRFREERPVDYPGTAVRGRPAEPYRRK